MSECAVVFVGRARPLVNLDVDGIADVDNRLGEVGRFGAVAFDGLGMKNAAD